MTRKEYLKPMLISLVLMALQQLSGINYVVGYSKEIFEVTIKLRIVKINTFRVPGEALIHVPAP